MSLEVTSIGQNLFLPEILNKHGQKQARFKILKSIEKITGNVLQLLPFFGQGTVLVSSLIGCVGWTIVAVNYLPKNLWMIIGFGFAANIGTMLAIAAAIAALALTVFGINYAVRKMINLNKVF